MNIMTIFGMSRRYSFLTITWIDNVIPYMFLFHKSSNQLHNTMVHNEGIWTRKTNHSLYSEEVFLKQPNESPLVKIRLLYEEPFYNDNRDYDILVILDNMSFINDNPLPLCREQPVLIILMKVGKGSKTRIICCENHTVMERIGNARWFSSNTHFIKGTTMIYTTFQCIRF